MPYRDPIIKCPKCKLDLPLNDFYISSKSGKRSSYCKECSKQYMREHKYYNKFRQEHREEFNKRQREYNDTENRKNWRKKYDQESKFPYHTILDNAGSERVCTLCGSRNNLGTHHKDGDHNNNDLSNLEWLCSSCHNKLHDKEKIPKLKRDSFGRFKRKEE